MCTHSLASARRSRSACRRHLEIDTRRTPCRSNRRDILCSDPPPPRNWRNCPDVATTTPPASCRARTAGRRRRVRSRTARERPRSRRHSPRAHDSRKRRRRRTRRRARVAATARSTSRARACRARPASESASKDARAPECLDDVLGAMRVVQSRIRANVSRLIECAPLDAGNVFRGLSVHHNHGIVYHVRRGLASAVRENPHGELH